MKFCFFHDYKTVTPSFMHLFVAKDQHETPASVPMFTGRECCSCGKRTLIRLQDKIPELIEERAAQWKARKLEDIEHAEQLIWFAQWNKFVLIKDLENFLMEKLLHEPRASRKYILVPVQEDDSNIRAEIAKSRRADFKLVVDNSDMDARKKHEA
jgi:hypothetical protein